jgi:SAM-dependent methyltransferase
MTERRRIEAVYRKYAASDRCRRRWASAPGQFYMLDRRWEATATLLRRLAFDPARARVLDVGASGGTEIGRFVEIGCRPESIVCADLMVDAASRGRRSHPRVPFLAADAARLPFLDGQFDLVHQSVMASSVIDPGTRAAIAAEMLRVTRPGGVIVWYDVRYRNPFNRETRPITRRDLFDWFGGCRGEIVSITLIPPLARVLAGVSRPLCGLLERLPLLRSHLLAVLVKP